MKADYFITRGLRRWGLKDVYTAVVSGYLFFGIFMSNFVTLFEGIDVNKSRYEEKRKEWEALFSEYPKVFDKNLKNKIFKHILTRQTRTIESTLAHHHGLIMELGHELEKEVIEKINASYLGNPSSNVKQLKDKFDAE